MRIEYSIRSNNYEEFSKYEKPHTFETYGIWKNFSKKKLRYHIDQFAYLCNGVSRCTAKLVLDESLPQANSRPSFVFVHSSPPRQKISHLTFVRCSPSQLSNSHLLHLFTRRGNDLIFVISRSGANLNFALKIDQLRQHYLLSISKITQPSGLFATYIQATRRMMTQLSPKAKRVCKWSVSTTVSRWWITAT